jgi:hypothetical protein
MTWLTSFCWALGRRLSCSSCCCNFGAGPRLPGLAGSPISSSMLIPSALATNGVRFNLTPFFAGYVTYDSSTRPPIKENHTAWSAVAGADYYELMKDDAVIYSGSFTEFEDYTKPVAAYQVRACNSSGCSAWKGGLSQ